MVRWLVAHTLLSSVDPLVTLSLAGGVMITGKAGNTLNAIKEITGVNLIINQPREDRKRDTEETEDSKEAQTQPSKASVTISGPPDCTILAHDTIKHMLAGMKFQSALMEAVQKMCTNGLLP